MAYSSSPSIDTHLHKQVVCHDCDQLMAAPKSTPVNLLCTRCGSVVSTPDETHLDTAISLLITALIAFVIANLCDLVRVNSVGGESSATLWQTVVTLQIQDKLPVAALVMMTGIILPFAELLTMLYVLLMLSLGQVPIGFKWLMRLQASIQPWSMIEIFLIGNLVALVKLISLATIHIGSGLIALFALTFLIALSRSFMSAEQIWARYDRCLATQ